jgi:hypothetical protein
MTNLLQTHKKVQLDETRSGKNRKRKIKKFHKVLLWILGVFLAIFIALALWGIANISAAKSVYAEALAAKQSFEYAQVDIGNQDFAKAQVDLAEAHEHFIAAQKLFTRFQVYRAVPIAARQMKALDNLLQVGVNLSAGLQKLAVVGERATSVIKKDASGSFADITPDEKRAVLQQLSESTADLHGVKADIELAVLLIDEIPETGLLTAIRTAVQPVKDQLPLLETLVYQALPAAETLPSIMGYPEEKTYLFLLQNNRELRPTGGFIGTYGILKLDAGEIAAFDTDNIYNLDSPVENIITEPSPEPIAKHTSTKNWLLRNINWSPDFPTTAQKAESKYYEEGGSEHNLDGVIAVTPTFIESLLELTGPITVDGIEFTKENLFETLEYQVEFGYYHQGVSDADRKEVIGDLSSELMGRLLGMQRSELPKLWETFVQNVDSKQMLIYVDDPITQELVEEQNWGGEMKHSDGDFLMVVDANLAALKTDEKMERDLSYSVSRQGNDYVGTATMHYNNTTQRVSNFYTRYRTYTRIYLPAGSTLISAEGFLTNDVKVNHGVPTEPTVNEETFSRPDGSTVSYTVVEGFTSIEPLEQRDLKITYTLPEKVKKQIESGKYDLYVQKQAGTIDHGLNVSIDIGRGITLTSPLDISPEHVDNRMSIQTDLTQDRFLQFSFH